MSVGRTALTVSVGVVLLAAHGLLFHLTTAEPRPVQPEHGVKLHQHRLVVFDLCENAQTPSEQRNRRFLTDNRWSESLDVQESTS